MMTLLLIAAIMTSPIVALLLYRSRPPRQERRKDGTWVTVVPVGAYVHREDRLLAMLAAGLILLGFAVLFFIFASVGG